MDKTIEQWVEELEKRVAELSDAVQPKLKNDFELDMGRPNLLKPLLSIPFDEGK